MFGRLRTARAEVGARFYDAIRPIQSRRHRGTGVQCPLCGSEFDRWMLSPGDGVTEMCWACHSYPRHRVLWLFFAHHPELLGEIGSLLHFAPERSLRAKFEAQGLAHYETADIRRDRAHLQLDITHMPSLPDASFDAILCSHVLEHVADDRAAMSELHRILTPGGWAIVMVPIDPERDGTYEDTSIVSPLERERAFWQNDHVRLYALDIMTRLEQAGFGVMRIAWAQEVGAEDIVRLGLSERDEIFLCTKAAGEALPGA
jgi:SAM-dependent methyltransferase